MVSHERLGRLGARIAAWATTRRLRVITQVLLLAGLVFALIRVRTLWHGGHVELANISWLAITGSVVLAAVGTAAGGFIWLAILGTLGPRTHRRWVNIFFQSQLGKYIPGSIWQYAGRAAIACGHGVPTQPVVVSMPIEFAASDVAAGSMAGFLLGWWGAAVIAAVALVLLALERPARSRGRPAVAMVRGTVLYLPVWLLLGAGFWLCAHGLVAVPAHNLPM